MNNLVKCPKCATENLAEFSFCKNCGYYLKDIGGTAAPIDFGDDITLREIALVTKDPSGKYERAFCKMHRTGKKININLPVLLSGLFFGMPFIWFFYRKMYKIGTVILLITLALSFATFYCGVNYTLLFMANYQTAVAATSDINFWQKLTNASNFIYDAFAVGISLFANYFYKNYCFKKIKSAKNNTDLLLAQKPTSIAAAIISVLIYFLVLFAFVFFFVLSNGTNYLPYLEQTQGILL